MIAIKNVLVATDFSPTAETALTYGRTLARTFGGDESARFVNGVLDAAAHRLDLIPS